MLVFSCVSTSKPASKPASSQTSNDWLFNYSWITSKPQYSVNVISKPGFSAGEIVRPSLFGQVAWLNSLLVTFSLHDKLSIDDIEKLAIGLFGDIPAQSSSGYFRAVGIAGYFSTKEPLIFYVSAGKPSDKAPQGSKIILQFTGNFIRTKDSKTGAVSTTPITSMISPGFNWFSNGVIFENSLIVKASYLYDVLYEVALLRDADGDKDMEIINVSDLYIKDELTDNDKDIEANLLSVKNNSKDTTKQCIASMNLFLYYLYTDNVAKAEEELAFAENLSKALDAEIQSAVNKEAKVMLEIYKRLRAAQNKE